MKTPRSALDAGSPGGLRPSRRSAVPAFIVMDVMEAAAAREAQGHKVIHMEVGQPGTPAPARRARCRQARPGSRDPGLHGGPGVAGPACPHRRPLPAALRPRDRAGTGGGDDGVVGRLRAGVPGAVRRRRQGGAAVARLSLLPAYPDRAGPGPRAAHDRCRFALDADRGADRRGRQRARAWPASSSPARPIRPAPCWKAAGSPRSSRPAGATTCGWSPTRSTTGSPTACRRRPRWPTARTRSWSTASRNTSR